MHCPKNNPNLCIKTDLVTVGAGGKVNPWFLYNGQTYTVRDKLGFHAAIQTVHEVLKETALFLSKRRHLAYL